MILTFFCFKFQDQIISMRKSIGIVLSILLFLQVIAQQNTIDSLHQLLMTAKEDTARINLLNLIAARYQQSNPDSIMKYSNEALAMSLKMNYVEGEVNAMRYQSAAFVLAGNFSTALEIALEALQKSEALGDKKLMARCLNSVGGVYAEQGDVRQAQIYALKMKDIYEQANDQPRLAGSLLNIGYGYGQVNQLDSARIYINRSLDISLRIKDDNMIAVAYLNLGMIHIKLKQYDIAAAYLKQAMPQFIKTYNLSFLYSTYFYLAEIFDSTRHYDSSLYYSRLAYRYAYQSQFHEIAKQLSSLFKQTGLLDSAFIYQEIAMVAKDSLTSQEKQKQMQTLTFAEQLRQMEIAKQKAEAAAIRKRNLELAGIAIFIPAFLFAVLLLGRRKVKSRTIEFLGILGLLFLFEFIVLLVHPYIGHWTHESPVLMLLILVVIAAILIPLHHRSEAWIKKKLANKPEVKLQPETL